MKANEHLGNLKNRIAADLPIAAPDLVKAGFVSRPTLWRMERAGLPVTRIGRRLFVKFSDLTSFRAPFDSSATDIAPVSRCEEPAPNSASNQDVSGSGSN